MPPVRLGARTYDDSARLVMGIVNATPDSFYDRGRAYALTPALEQVAEMVADGADVIDVGGVKAGLGPDPREPTYDCSWQALRRRTQHAASRRGRGPPTSG